MEDTNNSALTNKTFNFVNSKRNKVKANLSVVDNWNGLQQRVHDFRDEKEKKKKNHSTV